MVLGDISNKRVRILMQFIPEKESEEELVFFPFWTEGLILKIIDTDIENQLRFIVKLDKRIKGTGADMKKYKNVEYLFIVMNCAYSNEIDKLLDNNSLFCIVEYYYELDDIEKNYQADGFITNSAKIEILS